MTESVDENIKSELFALNPKEYCAKGDYCEKYRDHFLEQYKLYVEMADRISSRRTSANTFYLSVNTLLVTIIGIVSELQNYFSGFSFWWVIISSFAGILFSLSWKKLINSYRQLNSGKYKMINTMEEKLPLAMYKTEWSYLKPTGEPSRYEQLTKVETNVPIIFAGLYLALIIIGLINIIC